MADKNPPGTAIENDISAISSRLSEIEAKYFEIAGSRLARIYSIPKDELNNYFYSAEYLDDVQSDLKKVKRLLMTAHRENIKAMKLLASGAVNEAYKKGQELAGVKDGAVS